MSPPAERASPGSPFWRLLDAVGCYAEPTCSQPVARIYRVLRWAPLTDLDRDAIWRELTILERQEIQRYAEALRGASAEARLNQIVLGESEDGDRAS